MIKDFLWPKLDNIYLDNVYFLKDGATCQTSNETIVKLPDRVIFGRGDHNYPSISCDLTTCDFFLRGHRKDKFYEKGPASIQDFKDRIRKAIEYIG